MSRKNRRRRDLQRRRKRLRVFWLSVTLLATGYFGMQLVFGDQGLVKYFQVSKTHRQLQGEIDYLERQNGQLREQASRLKNDPEEIEAIARRELGLVKKGELIYQFKRDDQE